MIFDECHNIFKDTWIRKNILNKIFEGLINCKIIGMTGTPKSKKYKKKIYQLD